MSFFIFDLPGSGSRRQNRADLRRVNVSAFTERQLAGSRCVLDHGFRIDDNGQAGRSPRRRR
jgi:hypothetical protein